jgi:choice-of-anchor A domain-containing protein
MSRASVLAFTSLALLAAAPATAAPLTTAEILSQYNLVVFGNMTGSSEVEGRTFVGGNLSGNSMTFFTRPNTVPPSAAPALTVGGNVSGGHKNINGGGNVLVGGNVANMNMNGNGTLRAGGNVTGVNGGTVQQNQAVTIPSFEATLKASSTALAALTGTAPGKNGNVGLFNAATPSGGLAVYTTSFAYFSTIKEITLGLNGAETVIINVSGAGGKLQDNFLGGPFAAAKNVIWNFYEATALTFERQFFGSVLAPFADVKITSPIEGSLVAASMKLDGEMHLAPFAGTLPGTTPEVTPVPEATPVPAPAALPLLLVGLAGLAAVARRRAA